MHTERAETTQSSDWAMDWTVCFWTSSRSKRLLFFLKRPRPVWLWGPPRILFGGYQGALSLGIQQLGHEADSLPASSVEVKDGWSCTCSDYMPSRCGLGKVSVNLLYKYRCKLNWHQYRLHGFVSCFSISITPRLMTWLRKHQPVWPKAWLASLCQYWRQRCRSCRDMTREAWLDPSLALRYAVWWQKPSSQIISTQC